MKIYIMRMIEDIKFGGKVYTEAEARQLVDELDNGKYHPDAWADITDMDENRTLVPIYGDIGTDDMQDYCIGFEYLPVDQEKPL